MPDSDLPALQARPLEWPVAYRAVISRADRVPTYELWGEPEQDIQALIDLSDPLVRSLAGVVPLPHGAMSAQDTKVNPKALRALAYPPPQSDLADHDLEHVRLYPSLAAATYAAAKLWTGVFSDAGKKATSALFALERWTLKVSAVPLASNEMTTTHVRAVAAQGGAACICDDDLLLLFRPEGVEDITTERLIRLYFASEGAPTWFDYRAQVWRN